jgi:hypothetical protein
MAELHLVPAHLEATLYSARLRQLAAVALAVTLYQGQAHLAAPAAAVDRLAQAQLLEALEIHHL